MLNFANLTVFSYIADLGSISATARALNMPKSSVSRALLRLEDAVGTVLVERSTRHLRLTDAGLLLKRHAKRILDDVGEAENAIGGLIGKPSGDLQINAPFTFAGGPLAAMLPGFLEKYPEVRVVLTVENRLTDLQMEKIDLAIRIGPLEDSSLISRRLASIALWPCASPAYLSDHSAIDRPEQLLQHKLIAHADHPEVWRFRDALGASAIEVKSAMVITEPFVMKTVLIGGAGIGLLPDFHASDAVTDGRLIRLFSDSSKMSVDAHALYPSHRSLSAKVRVFIDSLVSHLGPTT
ncbi:MULTISPECIES: LysR family transcriptional regulator [unclassified Caballeronia]|uniref:LysR family transcriptional regulator n=1 Tax=unclassified Caballeronia TaxID=2646786 RepID=UPI002858AB75|nr:MULTISPECIES: LysR family transcriptional regulator [unclassified Caballeronia]MDR5776499.1 LysR family transcriptional regulator [Caballeronia sp. LZ002]MDR5851719.1 LysR family transcriptional regulator [Caballeronia sp. LZ003]